MASRLNPDFLMQLDFFSEFETEALKLILLVSDLQYFTAGDLIFGKGDMSDGGYVIASGKIALYEQNLAATPVLFAGPGTLIGELALISVTERPVSAVAAADSALLQITRGSFKRVLQEYPICAERLRSRVSSNLTAFLGDLKFIV